MKYLIILSLFFVGCTKDFCKTCKTTITTSSDQGYYDQTAQSSYVCNEEIKQLKDMDGTTYTYSGTTKITQTIKTTCN